MERVRGDWKVQTDLQRLRKNFPVNYGDLRTSLNILYVVLFAIFLPPHLLVGSKTLLEENLYSRRKKLDIADFDRRSSAVISLCTICNEG